MTESDQNVIKKMALAGKTKCAICSGWTSMKGKKCYCDEEGKDIMDLLMKWGVFDKNRSYGAPKDKTT